MIEQGTIAVRDGWDGARGRVRLAAAGDLMMGTTTAEMVAQKGPRWPFELVRDDFRDADVALVNIASTISDVG